MRRGASAPGTAMLPMQPLPRFPLTASPSRMAPTAVKRSKARSQATNAGRLAGPPTRRPPHRPASLPRPVRPLRRPAASSRTSRRLRARCLRGPSGPRQSPCPGRMPWADTWTRIDSEAPRAARRGGRRAGPLECRRRRRLAAARGGTAREPCPPPSPPSPPWAGNARWGGRGGAEPARWARRAGARCACVACACV